ncbi:MAG: hypothetical protein ABJC07_10375, partial [Acidobacteriota bacterium]
MRSVSHKFPTLLACALIGAATLAVFAGVFRNGFVSFEDEIYVLKNPHVRAGLSVANVAWAATATEASHWHPLTWISHMTDVSLWGLHPAGHHAASLLFHAGSVLLVFLLLRGETGSAGRSAAVALLFGLHPLRVESVAWVAERKDVLSVFFGLAAIGFWGDWIARRKRSAYGASLALFSASLLSNGTFLTLPLLLLPLDVWPFRRLPRAGEEEPRSRWTARFVEKIPFLVLSIAAAAALFGAQRGAGAAEALAVPFGLRLENAAVGS